MLEAAVQRELDVPLDVLDSRRGKWAESLLVGGRRTPGPTRLDCDEHKYLYLMDGGVSDNLGLHAFLREFRTGCIRKRIGEGRIRRLVVIIVDAATEKHTDYERSALAPGWLTSLLTTLDSGVENNSKLSSAVVRYLLEEADRNSGGNDARIESIVVDVDLKTTKDRSLLNRFMAMATSLVLPQGDVSVLIERGKGRILGDKKLGRVVAQINGE